MKYVLTELRAGKTAEQIKIDVTAPKMKTLLAVTFAKVLSELPRGNVCKCWLGLQKAYPSDNPNHEALLQEAKANRVRLFEGQHSERPARPKVLILFAQPAAADLAANEVQHLDLLVPRSSSRVELPLQLRPRVPATPFSTGLALSSVDGLRRQGTQGRR